MQRLLLNILFQTLFANFRNGRLWRKKRALFSMLALAVLPLLIIVQTSDMFDAWLLMPDMGANFLQQFVSTSLLGVMVFLILTGLPGVMHHFFLAPDLSLLQALPIEQRDIFLQKIIHAAANNAGMFFAVGLPILISMGLALHVSPLVYALMLISSLFFIFIPTTLAALLAFALARLFSIKKMRRVSTVVLGLFILSVWAGFQLLRLSRLNPMTPDFEPETATAFAAIMRNVTLIVWPSDWLVKIIRFAHEQEWMSVMAFLFLLIGTVAALVAVVLLWRIHLQDVEIHIDAAPRRAPKKHMSVKRHSVTRALLHKDFRLIWRDTRFFQSSFLLLAMLLLAPLFTAADAGHPEETLAFLLPYIPVTILSLIVSSTLARQSLPMERLAFAWTLVSPLKVEQILSAKLKRVLVLVGPTAGLAVFITAVKSETSAWLFFMLMLHAGLVVCGAALGLVVSVFTTRFNWTDPRYMANPASVYLFSIVVLVVGAVGLAIVIFGVVLFQLIIAFLIFFVYVFFVLKLSLRVARDRLRQLEWNY